MRPLMAVVNVVLLAVYPLGVWWSLTHVSSRTVGLVLMALIVPLLLVRLRNGREHFWPLMRLVLSVVGLLLLAVVFDDARFVLALPVLINVALLVQFASSLRGPMPIVERFARMQDGELTPPKVAHCRQATVAWSVFFALNAAACAALAMWAPVAIWAGYTGGLAYGLMFLMFAGEYIIRKARFREFSSMPHDRLLAKLFPPPEQA